MLFYMKCLYSSIFHIAFAGILCYNMFLSDITQTTIC